MNRRRRSPMRLALRRVGAGVAMSFAVACVLAFVVGGLLAGHAARQTIEADIADHTPAGAAQP